MVFEDVLVLWWVELRRLLMFFLCGNTITNNMNPITKTKKLAGFDVCVKKFA